MLEPVREFDWKAEVKESDRKVYKLTIKDNPDIIQTDGTQKEPEGVDLNIGPMPFSAEDRQEVSAIIAQYKSTGEMPKLPRNSKSKRKFVVIKDSVLERAKSRTAKGKSPVLELDK